MTDLVCNKPIGVHLDYVGSCGSTSAAFLLPRPSKGVLWPIPRQTHPARVAMVTLLATGLVDICSKCRTGRFTWRHLPSSPWNASIDMWRLERIFAWIASPAPLLNCLAPLYIAPISSKQIGFWNTRRVGDCERPGIIWVADVSRAKLHIV